MFQSAINSFRRGGGGGGYRGGSSSASSSWNKRRAAPQHAETGEEFIVGTLDNPPATPGLAEAGAGGSGPQRAPSAAGQAQGADQPAKKTKLGESLADVRLPPPPPPPPPASLRRTLSPLSAHCTVFPV